jgi:hypothetical protein
MPFLTLHFGKKFYNIISMHLSIFLGKNVLTGGYEIIHHLTRITEKPITHAHQRALV